MVGSKPTSLADRTLQVTTMDAEPRPAGRRGRRPKTAPSAREALLAAALEAFARQGYEAASLRKISEAVGVDVALTARLFGAKAGLWDAVIAALLVRLERYQAELAPLAAQAQTDPRGAFEGFVRLFAQMSFELPAKAHFVMREGGERQALVGDRLISPFHAACRPIIAAAMAAGVIGGRDPDLLLGMLLPAISVPLAKTDPDGAPAATAELRDALVEEILAALVRP